MPMNPIINISFSKHSISWDLIHHRILRPSESVMKEMCHNKTLDGLQKNCTNKIHTSTCTIYYTAKTTTIIKGTTVDTSNLQPGELIHMEFVFYNVTSIHGFTSMITPVCAKTGMIWVFPTAPKIAPVCIIRFTLTAPLNEKHPRKYVRVDEYNAFGKLDRCHKINC